ncbi:winged helix DNA-binding domain-containing protein [Paenibacillus sp. sgz500958]|uniref:winged helix DNA-binding domain-containing protein n=1 Tax=Paenibacillus sp. sgz500958 TaxID=3242475 RepID=UPI0036D3D67E
MKSNLMGFRRLHNLCIAGAETEAPGQVVQRLGALQAQDYMQSLWALGSRLSSGNVADIERAIAERQLLLTWVQRGTIHMVPSEDVEWMLRLAAPRVLRSAKTRLEQLELDERTLEKCRRIIYDALKGHKVITRPALMELLEQSGISTSGQRGYHILWTSAYHGLICFGPVSGKQQTFVLLDEWVPDSRDLSFEESLSELARRYFTSHGPATVQDFAWWGGLTLGDARNGLDMFKGELVSELLDGLEYWMPNTSVDVPHDEDVYLLAGFDEFILGYKDRSAVLEPQYAPLIVPGNNGIFLPTVVAGGQVIGTWRRTIKKKGVEITFSPFQDIGRIRAEVLQQAERYAAFMGLPLIKAEFL